MPANFPPARSPAVIQQAVQLIAKHINAEKVKPGESILIYAMLESARYRSECAVIEKIMATHVIDTNIT